MRTGAAGDAPAAMPVATASAAVGRAPERRERGARHRDVRERDRDEQVVAVLPDRGHGDVALVGEFRAQERRVARVEDRMPALRLRQRARRERIDAVGVPAEAVGDALRAGAAVPVSEPGLDGVPARGTGRVGADRRVGAAAVLDDLRPADPDVAGVVDVLGEAIGRPGLEEHRPRVGDGIGVRPRPPDAVVGILPRPMLVDRGGERARNEARRFVRRDVGRQVVVARQLRLHEPGDVDRGRGRQRKEGKSENRAPDGGRDRPHAVKSITAEPPQQGRSAPVAGCGPRHGAAGNDLIRIIVPGGSAR